MFNSQKRQSFTFLLLLSGEAGPVSVLLSVPGKTPRTPYLDPSTPPARVDVVCDPEASPTPSTRTHMSSDSSLNLTASNGYKLSVNGSHHEQVLRVDNRDKIHQLYS